MLFKQKHLEGIKSGKISLAFREWEKPAVKWQYYKKQYWAC